MPLLKEVINLFKNKFSKSEIENAEKLIFKILDYTLNIKTPFTFVYLFLSKGLILKEELPKNIQSDSQIELYISKYEEYV